MPKELTEVEAKENLLYFLNKSITYKKTTKTLDFINKLVYNIKKGLKYDNYCL